MSHWNNKGCENPSEQTYESQPYRVSVTGFGNAGPVPNIGSAAQQLRHATEQLELTRAYPGRTPPQKAGKFDCQQS
jgi:hypothetical protein